MNKVLYFVFAICISLLMHNTMLAEGMARVGQNQRIEIHIGDSLHQDSLSGIQFPDSVSDFKKEKLIAAILAFPVPFGFTGLHRIYLGSEPWIPVVYLITGGGGFGLVPLIDFIFIVTADEEHFRKYENSTKLFMWVE